MALTKYRHARVFFDSTVLLEATNLKWTKTSGHKLVKTPGGQGVMPSLLPVAVDGSIDIKVPRGGHEYDFNAALKEGTQITIRVDDLDAIEDAVCIIKTVDKSDNFEEDRNCTVSFEGSIVE